MAAAVLFGAASCTKEDISSSLVGNGQTVEVTFTANLPELGTRAIGEGEHARTLKFFVYEYQNDEVIGTYLPAVKIYTADNEEGTNVITSDSKYFNFSLSLIKGMKYNIVFWADKGTDSPYSVVKENGVPTGVISADYSDVNANDDTLDAFFGALKEFDPAAADAQTRAREIKLYRPFAQLNAKTNDIAAVTASGATLTKSSLTVKTYTTLDLFSGAVGGLANVTFKPNNVLDNNGYISMNYLLAPETKCTADVTFDYKFEGRTVNYPATTYTYVPLQRNYRTNIIGKLLTASTDFEVTIEADFGTPDETVATDALSLQEAINNAAPGVATEIALGGNIDLNDLIASLSSTRAAVEPALIIPAGKEIILNLNGYNLTYSTKEWNNNMIENNGKLTIQNGTVAYTFVGEPDTSYGSGNYAIVNAGNLTIDANITVKYKEETGKVSHALYAINAGNGNVVINGGTIYNKNNHAVRIWGSTESNFTVNNGTIKGARAIWMQLPNADTTKAPKVTVNIKGGNLIATGETGYKLAIYSYTYGNSLENVKFDITGGTFDGDIALSGGSNKEAVETVNISGGTFTDVYSYGDDTKAADKISISGGTFATKPNDNYLAEGYVVIENDGSWTVSKAVAKVGNTVYGSINEAIAAWTNNTTLTLLADVTLTDVVKIKSTEARTLDLGTYTLTAADKNNAIEVTCEGRSSASYALTVNADATNPGGITAKGKACIYYSKSDSTKDRPIIRIYNGVFNGSYSINSKSNGNTNCPQIWIYGGTFNGNVNLTKNMLRVFGGTFHGWINCTGDTSAYREISGGRFKSWQFMTADALGKFWVGTAKDTYDVGCYVDDEGYLVVGGPVITEFGDKFAAKATNATKWSPYLKYSSAAANGLYYTNAAKAIAKHGEANVVLK